jgi:hypothetical protein
MAEQNRIVAPGPKEGSVRTAEGQVLAVPAGWVLLPPGDAALTRRVKAAGPTWTVQEKRGRKLFSRGVWAPAETIAAIRRQLDVERAQPGHARKQEAQARRRQRLQADYVVSFRQAVQEFLGFAPCYRELGERLAQVVAEHATPVGSGTVARTQRISIERRAEAAVIAWLRHQTTAYDHMVIPRIKGKRREVRRLLAEQSRRLLEAYRQGRPAPESCPLQRALQLPLAPGRSA